MQHTLPVRARGGQPRCAHHKGVHSPSLTLFGVPGLPTAPRLGANGLTRNRLRADCLPSSR